MSYTAVEVGEYHSLLPQTEDAATAATVPLSGMHFTGRLRLEIGSENGFASGILWA